MCRPWKSFFLYLFFNSSTLTCYIDGNFPLILYVITDRITLDIEVIVHYFPRELIHRLTSRLVFQSAALDFGLCTIAILILSYVTGSDYSAECSFDILFLQEIVGLLVVFWFFSFGLNEEYSCVMQRKPVSFMSSVHQGNISCLVISFSISNYFSAM